MTSSIYISLFLLLSLSSCCSPCHTPLITLSQLVPHTSVSLHKPLFNMTLPTDTLTLTGVSLSCETLSGCGSISSLTLSLLDRTISIHSTLLQHYTSPSWSYNASFRLYIGPISAQQLTLSIQLVSNTLPVTIGSTLYGCEAEVADVPTRQILQYDVIPAPSTPDTDYTGVTRNNVASGGVGELTDQQTTGVVTWNTANNQIISLLFRLDKIYLITQITITSPDNTFSLTEVSTELRACEYSMQTIASVILNNCSGSYVFIRILSKSDSVSISELRFLTEEGELSGKNYPVTPNNNADNSVSISGIIFVTIVITFLLTSLLSVVIAVAIYTATHRRSGYNRWLVRARNFHKRDGDYITMKRSDKSSADPPSRPPDKADHDYCTIKLGDDLEASSIYVDMSESVVPKPVDAHANPPPSKEDDFYMSMKMNPNQPTAAPGAGGFFTRFRDWRAQWTKLPPNTYEGGSDNIKESKSVNSSSLSRRGGVRIKSTTSIKSQSTPDPVVQETSERDSENNSKGASKLKDSK